MANDKEVAVEVGRCSPPMKTWEVTVSAIYVGSVSIQAASGDEAVRLVHDRVRAGEISPDLQFSGYSAFDTPELMDEEDRYGG